MHPERSLGQLFEVINKTSPQRDAGLYSVHFPSDKEWNSLGGSIYGAFIRNRTAQQIWTRCRNDLKMEIKYKTEAQLFAPYILTLIIEINNIVNPNKPIDGSFYKNQANQMNLIEQVKWLS